MSRFFVGTLKQCSYIIGVIDAHMGYPDESIFTYSKPRQHAERPNIYAVHLKGLFSRKLRRAISNSDLRDRVPEQLRDRIKTKEQLIADGFFNNKNPNIPI